VLDHQLAILRRMHECNKSRSLLETKIELIAKLSPLVQDEHREALRQESKRAAAELDRLQPFDGVAWGAASGAGRTAGLEADRLVAGGSVGIFVVRATICQAMRIKGIRAIVYKHAEKCQAYYPEGDFARYHGFDLHICAAFEEKSKAMDFQTFLSQLPIDSPLLMLDGKVNVEEEVQHNPAGGAQKRVMLSHYKPTDSESPVQDSLDLQSATSSVDSTVGLQSEEFQFQRLEHAQAFIGGNSRAYTMHLKPQSEFKELRQEMFNRLAGTWLFHQNLDGLHTLDGHPGLAIRPRFDPSHDISQVVDGQERTRVEVLIEFRSEAFSKNVQLKDGSSRISPSEWASYVHVEDAKKFRECLDWKYASTKSTWREVDEGCRCAGGQDESEVRDDSMADERYVREEAGPAEGRRLEVDSDDVEGAATTQRIGQA